MNRMREGVGLSPDTDSVVTDRPDLFRMNRIAYQTIVRKEIRRFARIWVQTIVPPAVNALLYICLLYTSPSPRDRG